MKSGFHKFSKSLQKYFTFFGDFFHPLENASSLGHYPRKCQIGSKSFILYNVSKVIDTFLSQIAEKQKDDFRKCQCDNEACPNFLNLSIRELSLFVSRLNALILRQLLRAVLSICLILGSTSGLMLVGTGCGLKAPPIPPGITAVLAPTHLEVQVKDGQAHLTWTLLTTGNGQVKGFAVYQASLGFGKDACDGCPLKFQQIATTGPKERSFFVLMNSVENLNSSGINSSGINSSGINSSGINYFEIRTLGSGGMESSPSNRIKIKMP